MISQRAYPKRPIIQPERCNHVLYTQSSCNGCHSVCPTHAIQIQESSIKITNDCNGCEFCVPSCPNDVFSTDTGFKEDGNRGEELERVYCTRLLQEEKEISGPFPASMIPCLGSITDHFILDWFIERERPLELITGICHECPMKEGLTHFEERIQGIIGIFEYLSIDTMPVVTRVGTEEDIQKARHLYTAFKKAQEEALALSRRDFFLNFRSHVLPSREKDNKRKRAERKADTVEVGQTKKLRSLVGLFKKYQDQLKSGKTVPWFLEIAINDACNGCGVCANLCPTEALTLKKSREYADLVWTLNRCTQCRLCAEVCSKDAVSFGPCNDSKAIINETRRSVKHLYVHRCKECRREYISNSPEASCVHCLKEAGVMDDVSKMIYGEAVEEDSFYGTR
ncbi:MAG: 4Fe-4S binding protein [Deltaproteobacteria bacterium]|nr:4Fe-4S binding protein [Deltaproteobacteria bacterium]